MHRSIKRIVLIVSFMLCLGAAWASERMALTLQQSVDLALDNNPEVLIAGKEFDKARAAVWEARSNILPQINAHASFQHAWEIQETTIPNFLKPMLLPLAPYIPGFEKMPDYVQLSFGLQNTFSYGATLTQPLFLGGAGIAGVQIAQAGKRAAELNLESKRQNIIYQAADAFLLCLLTKEIVRVQNEALNQAEANLDIVIKKYNVGSASGFDKMRAAVEVANLKPEVISAKNNHQLTLTQLRNVLGLDRNKDIDVVGELTFTPDSYADMSLVEFKSLALEARPEIHALLEQKYIAGKGMTIARSSFMPKLFFQTDYSFLAMRNDYKFRQDDFSKGFTSAISLQIPLFTSFRNSKSYQKAKLDYRIMQDTEKQVGDGISAESEMAYNKFNETAEKYKAAKESVGMAEEALRLADLMYEEGANTQLDVLNSQLALNRARLNYVTALYEYQMARYMLRKVTGKLKGVL